MSYKEDFYINLPDTHRELLQLIFDKFVESGKWPLSREIQILFYPNDFWTVIEVIDFHLIRNRGSKSHAASDTQLSIEGIALCKGSEKHVDLFIRALEKCVEAYIKNPLNATITQAEIREVLKLDERESSIAMGMLFVGNRIWSSASGDANVHPMSLTLDPDILRYRGATNFKQYLEVVFKHRPQMTALSKSNLRPNRNASGPIKELANLHPQIAERCEKLFFDEHFSEAVEASFKVVKDKLRELTGYERGSDAFGKGQLHISGSSAQNVDKDFNEGVKHLLMAIDFFRNEKSHTSNDQIQDPRHAMEYLTISSLAMKILDRADATEIQSKKTDSEIALEKAKQSSA